MKKTTRKIAALGFGVALAFGTLAVPTAATAQVTSPATARVSSAPMVSEVGEIQPFATIKLLVRCHIVDHAGEGAETIGYVVGSGSGNTQTKARAAARSDANAYLHPGEYPRHCQYSSNLTKWRLGVDRNP